MFDKIRKRDKRIVEFNSSKVTATIAGPRKATGDFVRRARKNLDLVENYIQKLDWKVRENSNMSYSLQGLNNFVSSDVTSQYWLNRVYLPEIRHAHESGDIHIHDLSMLSAYCVGWDLKDLLKQGFKGVGGKIESGPPKHLSSALGQIVNFFYTLQGEAAGAQAVSNFDTLLAPFVRYDNLDYKQLIQAFQEFVFNMNIPTRVGFQTPFTNLTMDLQVSPILKHHPVIIGGIERKETYSDFQSEMEGKETDLDKIASDVETVRKTIENLDFGGTAEGSELVESSIKSAEDVTTEVFDKEDESLEQIQTDNEEF